MIEQSEQLKSAAEHRAANLADKLVPYTLLGSALVYLLTRNTSRALSVLMVDFSLCAEVSHAADRAVGHAPSWHFPCNRQGSESIWKSWPAPTPLYLTKPAP